VHRQEGYWSATSFSCIVTPESSYANVWAEIRHYEQIPVSSRGRDFQCVIAYTAGGEVIQYMKGARGGSKQSR
jgi:hypothetical protein